MHFIENLSLNFLSFWDLYLNESGSSGDNNRWYPWCHGIALAGATESKIGSFHFVYIKSTLEFKWYTKNLWPSGKKMLG